MSDKIRRPSVLVLILLVLFALAACAPVATPAPTSALPTTAAPTAAAPPTIATVAATTAATTAATKAATAAPTTAATTAPTTAATTAATSGASASGTIALLLPETKTTRYETADRPDFEAKFKALCPNCKEIYSNANQDATAQANQVDAALTNGAKVMVLDPVDSAAAAALADKAKAQGVPVIAYDRLILNSAGVNYYISFDNV
ncbi:MAG: substrate-binding domain-containing protein, partial [Chloroflexi bacterium]|nr:substrate-binding domain-containing protein [Chloroflexota bacterium]